MAKVSILLIDDSDYGLEQVRNAVPEKLRGECAVQYMNSIAAYRAAGSPQVDIALLDFFLDHDRTTGEQVAHEIRARHLVGFSSVANCSHAIAAAVTPQYRERGWPVPHAVQKLRGERNEELELLLAALL